MNKKINILGIRKKVILSHTNKDICTILQPITDEQETLLNTVKEIKLDGHVLNRTNILFHGNVDFDDENDLKTLDRLTLADNMITSGEVIYSRVDYNTGDVDINGGREFVTETYNKIQWLQYCLLLLGYPKYVVCYKINKKLL